MKRKRAEGETNYSNRPISCLKQTDLPVWEKQNEDSGREIFDQRRREQKESRKMGTKIVLRVDEKYRYGDRG